MASLTITQPDDWHLHLRDGDALQRTVPDSARCFARAIVMPNLKPPVLTAADANAYRQRIIKIAPHFQPLMTLYLTDQTTPKMVDEAKASGVVFAAKLYPAGATTNSESGVTAIKNIYPVLETMQNIGMPLLIHGEVTNQDVDVFDREAVFIEAVLTPLTKQFPELKIVLEHITTQHAVDFVRAMPKNIAATITAHHLLLDRNAMFQDGFNPHHYCLPVLKRRQHQTALIHAATSGNPKFFLGTDSAPHAQNKKEAACGCAGIYTAHAAIELYAEVFEKADALDKLEAFASFHGADFYNLPRNKSKITLKKETWTVPKTLSFGKQTLIPLYASHSLHWKFHMGSDPQ